MRVFVVIASAVTLVACTCLTPHPRPIHRAAKIRAGMKKKPTLHERAGGNATKQALPSSGLDEESAAKTIKGIISAKLGNAESIVLSDMARGKDPDSFCGVAQVKNAPNQETDMPFVYFTQSNKLYIIDGSDDRGAAAAIHRACD